MHRRYTIVALRRVAGVISTTSLPIALCGLDTVNVSRRARFATTRFVWRCLDDRLPLPTLAVAQFGFSLLHRRPRGRIRTRSTCSGFHHFVVFRFHIQMILHVPIVQDDGHLLAQVRCDGRVQFAILFFFKQLQVGRVQTISHVWLRQVRELRVINVL